MKPTALVVGAGIYGCMTALELAKGGFAVDLIDQGPALLMGATDHNQGRLHLGYHYPRSLATTVAAGLGFTEFRSRYGDCLDKTTSHYYAIADESKVSVEQFEAHCKQADIPFTPCSPPVRTTRTQKTLAVNERFIDMARLRTVLAAELSIAGVKMTMGTRFDLDEGDPLKMYLKHDVVVDATYGQLELSPYHLRYEITEIVMARLPDSFRALSVVVVDGPFGSVDPVPHLEEKHVLYHVDHSIHHFNIGRAPVVPDYLAKLVNKGWFTVADLTHFRSIAASTATYLPGVLDATYLCSAFSIRAVRPDVDDTDARLGGFWEIGANVISILPGKLGDAMNTARRVASRAQEMCQIAAG